MANKNNYVFGEDCKLDQIRTNRNISKVLAGLVGRKKKRERMLRF